MEDLRRLIENYLKNAKIMQLSTVNEGSPWICTVNYVVDSDLNLYWMSMRRTRHSEELEADSRTAVAIVIDPVKKVGIQMQGNASEVGGDELIKAHKLYCESYGNKEKRLVEAKSGDKNVRGYYKFIPSKVMLFDETNENSPIQELKLTLA
jgi:uncharacterized protein YhbP (UPF0306 family)